MLSELNFAIDNFEIDPANYMKFDNYSFNMRRTANEDCILVCDSWDIKEPRDAIAKIKKQFFSDNDLALTKWNGGKINHSFIEQVTKDGAGENPRIELSKYNCLNSGNETDEMLIGYGETTVRKVNYAGIRLAKIVINTNLVASYAPGMEELYDDFIKYVEIFISAMRNDGATGEGKSKGLKVVGSSISHYFWQWRFGNEGEWDIIQNEITKEGGDGTITFDWIMENVLYKKRILLNDVYSDKLPTDTDGFKVPRTSLKSKNEIKYVKSENPNKYLVAKGYGSVSAIMYLKYGPFTI